MTTTDRTGPPARTWRRAGIDAAWILGAFALFPLVAALAPDDPAGPLRNAERLVAFERDLGWYPEPGLIAWAVDRPGLVSVLLFVYLWAHVPATVGAMVWAWLERRAAFQAVRNAFLAMQALVVTGYLLFPTAPPRMLLPPGEAPGLGPRTEAAASWVQSPYAAMPSGHVAFACFTAGVVALLAGPRIVRLGVLLYPGLIVAITLVTANHFWIDAVAGLACTVVGAGAAFGLRALQGRSLPRLRPVGDAAVGKG